MFPVLLRDYLISHARLKRAPKLIIDQDGLSIIPCDPDVQVWSIERLRPQRQRTAILSLALCCMSEGTGLIYRPLGSAQLASWHRRFYRQSDRYRRTERTHDGRPSAFSCPVSAYPSIRDGRGTECGGRLGRKPTRLECKSKVWVMMRDATNRHSTHETQDRANRFDGEVATALLLDINE